MVAIPDDLLKALEGATGTDTPNISEAQAKQLLAEAGDAAEGAATGGANSAKLPDWQLDVSGLKDWFFRGLMVTGGLVLMTLGISKMLNVGNKVTDIASKVPVIP